MKVRQRRGRRVQRLTADWLVHELSEVRLDGAPSAHVECSFLRSPDQAPYEANSACAKRAASYAPPPPCSPPSNPSVVMCLGGDRVRWQSVGVDSALNLKKQQTSGWCAYKACTRVERDM